ncbi:hypothetical protein EDB85DRAFT_1898410 [Lactarius pseudohatsudake]|nr:hypothetical protein EDB85DRAFT_1898410 [Lactarius pseudohatsudake]
MEHHHQNYEAAAMDTYTNARSRGVCRRKVSDEFFGNKPVSRLCCDTCNPGSFILPIPTTSAPKQTRAPNKFKASLYKSMDADLSLASALRDWRNAQLGLLGIPTRDNMYGAQFIMPDDLLERFVELAHFNQVADLSSIRAQVNWCYVDTWGAQILELIKKHVPVTDSVERRPTLRPTENIPGPSTGRQPPGVQTSTITPTQNASGSKPRTRSYKCSACGSSTHIGTLTVLIFLYRQRNGNPSSF